MFEWSVTRLMACLPVRRRNAGASCIRVSAKSAISQISRVTGTGFLQRWGAPGLSVADLFGFVTSLMPEYEPGSLTEQEYADVLAFILRENGYGAGLGELARDIEQLETVVLDRLSALPDSGRR